MTSLIGEADNSILSFLKNRIAVILSERSELKDPLK